MAILSTSISLSCQLTCVLLPDLCLLIKVYQLRNPHTYINTNIYLYRETHSHKHTYISTDIHTYKQQTLWFIFIDGFQLAQAAERLRVRGWVNFELRTHTHTHTHKPTHTHKHTHIHTHTHTHTQETGV